MPLSVALLINPPEQQLQQNQQGLPPMVVSESQSHLQQTLPSLSTLFPSANDSKHLLYSEKESHYDETTAAEEDSASEYSSSDTCSSQDSWSDDRSEASDEDRTLVLDHHQTLSPRRRQRRVTSLMENIHPLSTAGGPDCLESGPVSGFVYELYR
jgi:hypothetical protein